MIKNTLRAIIIRILRLEAELVILKYKPRIVGVTGNVGKTSTKDAIHSVLRTTFDVRKSQKSFNSELGVPLTILGCDTGWCNPLIWIYNIFAGIVLLVFPHRYPEWLVLEMGADRPGDIKSLARWLPLDFAVVTSIGDVPVHIEYFKTKELLAKEKECIIGALKAGGVAVLNADDPLVAKMKDVRHGETVTYGFAKDADIKASHDKILYQTKDGKEFPEGISFKIEVDGESGTAKIKGIFGKHHIYPVLAAAAVGRTLKISLEKSLGALEDSERAPGRLRLIEGEKETIILDDTYNASPLSTGKALESLEKLKSDGRKIAVLGDMLELGEHTIIEHEKLGKQVAKFCDFLITAGQRAKYTADGAREAGMAPDKIEMCDTAYEAGKYLEQLIKPGDFILVKGSQGMRMEKVVEEIMAHYEDAEKLLVRQEKEWKDKEI